VCVCVCLWALLPDSNKMYVCIINVIWYSLPATYQNSIEVAFGISVTWLPFYLYKTRIPATPS